MQNNLFQKSLVIGIMALLINSVIAPFMISVEASGSLSNEDLDWIISELNLQGFDRLQLVNALNREIESGYETYVFVSATLNEIEFINDIWTQGYKNEFNQYFIKLLNSKVDKVKFYERYILESVVEVAAKVIGSFTSLAASSALIMFDIIDAGIPLLKLYNLQLFNALYEYLFWRVGGSNHQEAWEEYIIDHYLFLSGKEELENKFECYGDKWTLILRNGQLDDIRSEVKYELRQFIISLIRPKAFFDAEPISGYPPLYVHFDASQSQPSEGETIEKYSWICYKNGEIFWEVPPNINPKLDQEFSEVGEYEVKLIVEDSSFSVGSFSKTVSVKNPLNARFEIINFQPGPAPREVYFDATNSSNKFGEIDSYNWNFGDPESGENNSKNGSIVSHTFKKNDTYWITLNITGSDYSDEYIYYLIIGSKGSPTFIPAGYVFSNNAIFTEYSSPYVIQGIRKKVGGYCNYWASSVTVAEGATLTIQPGVVVKFENKYAHLSISGTLIADGEPDRKIVFTSIRDDSYGGDTNNDENASSPAKGDWGAIQFGSTSTGNIMDHTVIKYACSDYSYYCHISTYHRSFDHAITSASPLIISNSVISENDGNAIYLSSGSSIITGNNIGNNSGKGLISTSTSSTIIGNSIHNNTDGITASSSSLTIIGNTISNCSSIAIAFDVDSSVSTVQDNILTGNSINGIYLYHGTITIDCCWSSDNPYVIQGIRKKVGGYCNYWASSVTVAEGATLTIQPGVVVKFGNVYAHLNIGGTLVADGEHGNEIVFTSIRDDSYGGDTNNDGNASSPAKGDWGAIQFESTSTGSLMDYTIVKYACSDYSYYCHISTYHRSFDHAISSSASSFVISNSFIGENDRNAIYISSGSAIIDGNTISNNIGEGIISTSTSSTIIGNSIHNNSGGIIASSSSLIIIDNIVSNNSGKAIVFDVDSSGSTVQNNTLTGNNINGIYILDGTINTNCDWGSDSPYVIQGVRQSAGGYCNYWAVSVGVAEGVTLTINPGVVVKFENKFSHLSISGTLIANGEPDRRIVFTSLRDDSYGGDTNNDGNTSSPAKGNWGAIEFGSTSTSNILDHTVVKYACSDYSYYCHISMHYRSFDHAINSASSVVISNSVIDENDGDGIYLSSGSSIITGNTISNNSGKGIISASTSSTIIGNNIHNNTDGITASYSSLTITDNIVLNNSGKAIAFDCGTSGSTVLNNTLTGNNINGIYLSDGTIRTNCEWSSDSPYILQGRWVYSGYGSCNRQAVAVGVAEGVTLTISPGVVVKFENKYAYMSISGTLIADGEPDNKIVFTSIRDDSYGGDTNNDGNTSSPAKGDWGSIQFGSTSTGNILNHTVVKYACSDWSFTCYMRRRDRKSYHAITSTSPLNISNSVISENDGNALSLSSNSLVQFNTINNNNGYGIKISGVNSSIINNNFINNTNQAYDTGNNIWNNSYPSGGNYWSTYDEPSEGAYDNYLGVLQDIPGNDGIADNPYSILGGSNYDKYPLMKQWVPNKAPLANIIDFYIGEEGSYIILNASLSSDPDGDTLKYRWDFNNDSTWDTEYSTNATANYTWYDDYEDIVIVEVSDGIYSDIDTANVTINNVAPTADAGIDHIGDEPSTFVFSGSHIDPGILDTHIYEWDFDYDSITFDVDAIGNNISYTWLDDFNGTIVLNVTDDDGGWDIDTCSVIVNNVPPVALPNGPYTADENTQINLAGDVIDLGLFDTHTFKWDIDDDGIYETTGQNITFNWNDDYSGIIWLNVTDDDGDFNITNTTISVNNVKPNITETKIEKANNAQLRLIETHLIVKPPKADSFVNVTFYEDNQPLYYNGELVALNRTNASIRFLHDKNKTYVAHYDVEMLDLEIKTWIEFFMIIDGDIHPNTKEKSDQLLFNITNGTYQEYDLNVTGNLTNITGPPGLLIYNFMANVTDPGSDDLEFTWDFGDGEVETTWYYNKNNPDQYPSPYNGIAPLQMIDSVNHMYDAKGSYAVNLTVKDDDGGIVSNIFDIYVE